MDLLLRLFFYTIFMDFEQEEFHSLFKYAIALNYFICQAEWDSFMIIRNVFSLLNEL